MPFTKEFRCGDSGYFVYIEDDGRSCYAYLIRNDAMVGDVWLCNRVPAPETAEWADPNDAPFLNPKAYAAEPAHVPVPPDGASLNVRWNADRGAEIQAHLLCGERVLAMLQPGAKPGWCVNARRDGPLAKILASKEPKEPRAGGSDPNG